MFKQITIIIIVLVLILVGDILTHNNTKRIVGELSNKLYNLRESILNEDNMLREKIEDIFNLWNEEYRKLAYYIEHNELEKVETELTKLKADIEVKEYGTSIENLDNCIFILKHIKDKNSLKIINVF